VAKESNNQKKRAITIIAILRTATKDMSEPAGITLVKQFGRNPYLVLVSCILSLRTKDTVSLPASQRLFAQAQTPSALLSLTPKTIQDLIYPVGFYRQKTEQLLKISSILQKHYNSAVPNTEKDLLALPGVGPKTTNLVLSLGFNIPALCVDTHVHRISNRLGLVNTKTPEETESELKQILPEQYWSEFNELMVMWGQNICVPISPLCSQCPLLPICPQKGVTRRR
jgi:endonuclease-3